MPAGRTGPRSCCTSARGRRRSPGSRSTSRSPGPSPTSTGNLVGHNSGVDTAAFRGRVETFIRAHELIPPGGAVTCLVSGGADSTCLWHALRGLGYDVSALHVNHGLRPDADDVARLCAERFGAEVVDAPGTTEAELRELRYSFAADRLRATGHTASDQVETILYRLVTSGRTTGIKVRREDGVVRPLLSLWRSETRAYCEAAD